jgi:hypothetical protein
LLSSLSHSVSVVVASEREDSVIIRAPSLFWES